MMMKHPPKICNIARHSKIRKICLKSKKKKKSVEINHIKKKYSSLKK